MTRAPSQSTAVWAASFPSRLGWMAVAGRGSAAVALVFACRNESAARTDLARRVQGDADWTLPAAEWTRLLQAYAEGEPAPLSNIRVDYGPSTEFCRRVLEACRGVAYGETISYGALAARVGRPRAARAVGSVMAGNRLPLLIPCHRVVGAGGDLCGFSARGGQSLKKRLLEMEAAAAFATR